METHTRRHVASFPTRRPQSVPMAFPKRSRQARNGVSGVTIRQHARHSERGPGQIRPRAVPQLDTRNCRDCPNCPPRRSSTCPSVASTCPGSGPSPTTRAQHSHRALTVPWSVPRTVPRACPARRRLLSAVLGLDVPPLGPVSRRTVPKACRWRPERTSARAKGVPKAPRPADRPTIVRS